MNEGLINILRSLLGLFALIGIAFIFSRAKKFINWKLVGKGILLQFIIALFILKVPYVIDFFNLLSGFFVTIFNFANYGTDFLFGKFSSDNQNFGFVFALRVLPPIVFFSALTSLLYYLKILPFFVNLFAKALTKILHITGAESLAAAGNVFLGHTEAPLLVRPYLDKMTKSEIHCLVSGGFATISGAVLAACVGLLGGDDPIRQQFFATQFLTASIISAPAAIVISKILFPEQEEISKIDYKSQKINNSSNVFDAIANGTFDGTRLAVNVAAMLLVFISLVNLVNYSLSDIIAPSLGINTIAGSKFSLELIFSWVFSPVSWLIGIDSADMLTAGRLLGEKTVINEFYAYVSMNDLLISGELTNQRSIVILSYALCGFANFGSIGIMIGAISSLAPNQRTFVAKTAISTLFAGTLACLMTATIAGLFFW